MSLVTQQTGRYRMRHCAACAAVFTYDHRSDRHALCYKCRRERQSSHATGVNPSVTVENRGTIPGGTMHSTFAPVPLKRIYYP